MTANVKPRIGRSPTLWAFLFMMAGCAKPPAAPAPERRETATVEVTNAAEAPFLRTVRVTGTLFADEETVVAAKVPGRIAAVKKEFGDAAHPGECLVILDATDYELQKVERERAFRQALAVLGLERLPDGEFDVDRLPSVEGARLEAENAKSRFERGRSFMAKDPPVISDQEFADLRTAADVADAALRKERLAMHAKLAEARTLDAQVKTAEQRLADTKVYVPVTPDVPDRDFEVAQRLVSVGDFVQAGAPLFRLVDPNPLKLRAEVPARRSAEVQKDEKVQVRVDAFQETFAGRVSRLSPVLDKASRTFQAEILIDNGSRRLKPGLFAVGEIEVRTDMVLALPENCIRTFAGVTKVVTFADGKAIEKRVELGARQNGKVEIKSGVGPAEKIVIGPDGSLVTGTPLVIGQKAKEAAGAETR